MSKTITEIMVNRLPLLGPCLSSNDKMINSNFGSIRHLRWSKMIDDEDVMYDLEGQKKFTECKRDPNDAIYVTEKVDGMNAGALMYDGEIYPINRKGYDVRTQFTLKDGTPNWLFYFWARWVNDHVDTLKCILSEGEHAVFENCMMIHTLRYTFKDNNPVFFLSKHNKKNARCTRSELIGIAVEHNLKMPPLLAAGCAIDPLKIISQYGHGLAGCREDMEGAVYTYEHGGKFESSAKFVSNPKMGTVDAFPTRFNEFKDASKYIAAKRIILDDYEGGV